MFGNRLQKVGSAAGVLQGTATQVALEQAGIPVTLGHSKTSAYLDILVPRELAFTARRLLFPEPRAGDYRTAAI